MFLNSFVVVFNVVFFCLSCMPASRKGERNHCVHKFPNQLDENDFFPLMNCKFYVNCVGFFLKHDACFVIDLRSIFLGNYKHISPSPAVKKTFDKTTALKSPLEFQGGRLRKAWKINER